MAAATTATGRAGASEASSSTSTEPPRVVLFASPGAGHLIPLAELARGLATDHGFAVQIVTIPGLSDPATDAAVLSTLPPSIVTTAALPAVSLADLPAGFGFGTVMFELVRRSLPHLLELMEVSGSTAALVCDFFGTEALPLAAELGVPGYVFFPNSFAMISIMRRIAELHADHPGGGEYRDLPDPLPLPGGPMLRHADIPDGFRDRTDAVYAYLVEEARRYGSADGFLVNSFEELERAMAESFRRDAEDGAFPPVFPVGPFVRSSSSGKEVDRSACLEWLDRQPEGSVVYVSFGTGGALSVEQTAELAAGLEASGHRFLWVVRMPSLDGNPCALGTIIGDEDDPLAWLPEGFLECTRGRGLAVAAWAPQVRVLSHPATAAFLSHCGWNSTLESVAAGVPIVAWPLYAEQKMNAAILTEVTGVALRPVAAHDDGFVTREDVTEAVKEIMEGEKGSSARARARELQEAASRAWAPEGSSRRALEDVASKWKKGARLNENSASA